MYIIRVEENSGHHTTLRFADSETDNVWYVWDFLVPGGKEQTHPQKSMTMHHNDKLVAAWPAKK